MEIYSFYTAAISSASKIGIDNIKTLFLIGIIVGLAIFSVFFILQGIGLYQMAKNRGVKNKALAFVPFVNLLFVGKLAGECNFFGQKVKRAGMYAMIAQIIGALFCVATIAAEMYLYLEHGEPQINEDGIACWVGLTGFAGTVSKFYALSFYILSTLQLIYEIFLVVLFVGLYKQYSPKNYMWLGLLTLFVLPARYITVFVLRKRKAIDYEAYMRAQREAYARAYGQYRKPYGSPYQNPYGQPQDNAPQPPQPEDPFEEFSSSQGGEDEDEFFS